eukprot:4180239-Prymnesium_polylepis.1
MPPASRIATLFSALVARFRSAAAACSFCASVPSRASATTIAMPPASRIATLFSALVARFPSAPAACSFCAS